ncbi:fumarylacetoacetate hydrolase family protein [Brevibacterium luteolum]|uniref:Fumarylacetoacetase-like C-terminal domain-containing protein n=1 Tax=Brevibacterium luteolum TaxID=199591 RepID=A0A2N6PHT7_9MICO|nr:fumarylacetoacetate hydrolase family protein [Brevibacterium luteolum]MCT1829222.1 fumarylacetoacetate hydrolase family protein [Brevibacterium luteolum]PMB98255.1 hypothetical protein CJ198_07785 [Brevibacterium luteolum]
MKLWRIGEAGSETPVASMDGTTYDVSSLTTAYDADFFARDGLAQIADAIAAGELPAVEVDENARIGAPLTRPQALICIGQNYAAHAAESGSEPPKRPIIFFKHPNTIAGPNDMAYIPKGSKKTDWEVELGVVIGKEVSYLDSNEEAAEAIAGYVLCNDLSERDFQLEVSGGQWSKGKVAPGFSPLGPWMVTADDINAHNLSIRSWVNGEPRQDSTTADMIFSVEDIVRDLSQYMKLSPGDVILTGTPQGVALSGRFPYLSAGDVVEVEIEGLGRQRQEFANA